MDTLKHCPGCSNDLACSMFTRASRCRDGLSPYCRNCISARNKASHIKARDQRLKKAAAYRKANRELLREKLRAWQETHRDHIRQYGRANRKRMYVVNKRYRDRHPERVRARYAERHARMQVAPWANKDAIEAIYKRAAMLSQITGIPHEVDHIVPLRSKHVNGLHCETNLQILTRAANRKKSNHFNTAFAA